MLGNGQFKLLRESITAAGVALNIAAPDEHVPEIERYICTVKERTRSIQNTLPFTRFPHVITICMVNHSVLWLNMIPPATASLAFCLHVQLSQVLAQTTTYIVAVHLGHMFKLTKPATIRCGRAPLVLFALVPRGISRADISFFRFQQREK